MVPTDARPAAGTGLLDSLASVLPSVRRTDVEMRNYDEERAYELTVRARGADGDVFERRYSLDPGDVLTERNLLDEGTYEVTVESATGDRDTARCHVGGDPAQTIRVEAGNSVITVSDGVS